MIVGAAPDFLDGEAVEALLVEIMESIKRHYGRRPVARSSAQEVLNALAIAAATILTAAREVGDEEGAMEFFDLALENQMEAARGGAGGEETGG